jgi:hypothetical protein
MINWITEIIFNPTINHALQAGRNKMKLKYYLVDQQMFYTLTEYQKRYTVFVDDFGWLIR